MKRFENKMLKHFENKMPKHFGNINRNANNVQKKAGTTLVESIVTLLLITIMLSMAASTLSSASRIFVRVQNNQRAQSIMDTAMTELRTITQNASGYIKIYAGGTDGSLADGSGVTDRGTALEFLNEEGYAVLVTTDGCRQTTLYIGNLSNGTAQQSGTADAVKSGQLLTRYYFPSSGTQTYIYQQEGTGSETGGTPVARAVATVFGEGFYMGNYMKVTYAFPEGTKSGDKVECITATVTVYSDEACTKAIAQDSEILQFRYSVTCKTDKTAVTSTT